MQGQPAAESILLLLLLLLLILFLILLILDEAPDGPVAQPRIESPVLTAKH
jgi:hypothetical protein